MGTSQIAHGWDSRQAVNFGLPGRIAAVGGLRWTTNGSASYMGFDSISGAPYGPDGDAYDDSKFAVGKLIEWCCGKTTGASILMMTTTAYTSAWGTWSRQAIGELGHTLTLTEDIHFWGSYEPLDFDLLITHENLDETSLYHGLTAAADKWEYFFDHGGHVLTALNDGNDTDFQPYGLNAAYLHNANEQAPMVNSVFHPTGTLLLVMRSSNNVDEQYDPPSAGGTVGFIPCDTHPTGCGDPNGCYIGGWWTK